jgi:hypothetical protein
MTSHTPSLAMICYVRQRQQQRQLQQHVQHGSQKLG